MDFNASTLWWLLTGVLVAAELTTGTFYLLMLGVGAAAGALAAHAGLGTSAQMVTAALVGIGATAGWHLRRARHPQSAPAEANRDVILDIGETLDIDHWNPDRTTRAQYRGAAWSVRLAGDGTPAPGPHRIVAMRGNELSVQPV